ncbi:uncharacterized protein LOC105699316 [Orussus abietinus]|uniref:uncharacterized protein LOC105699316 n=1 Tax=Orussus abietinus TaxID=222816 RepID=UPI000625BDF7|nr:uncharacterized protein LOC105699316 [Orussus abietinus]
MSDVKILDGSFSSQLSTHVGERIDGDPLWTARFLATNPAAVQATHLDYLRAGSDIIETNTYQASIGGFVRYLGLGQEESLQLFHDAVKLAKRAVQQYKEEIDGNDNIINTEPAIAGSCGPYGAAQHDGSDYTGLYAPDVTSEIMATWHRPRIEALIKAGVDLLAIETIPNMQEAMTLVNLLKEYPDTKAWLSFSCSDDGKSLADGNSFQEVALHCCQRALPGQLVAVGVNCLSPKTVAPLLKGINARSNKREAIPLVVYPNSGEKYTASEGWKMEPNNQPLESFVKGWLDLGVRYIGSCCRTYATDIIKIRAEVKRWQAEAKNSV